MKILNFIPKNHYFSTALIKWNGIALNGNPDLQKPTFDLSGENITELLLDLFDSLSFTEICLLYHCAQKHPRLFDAIDWKLFFKKQNIHINSRNLQLLEKLKSMPEEFLIWAQDHQMSSKDLMPINSLDNPGCLKDLTKIFSKLKLNRNEGKKTLDLLVDLVLMNHKAEDLTPSSGNWFQQLMAKRYPNTLNNDKWEKIKKDWPNYVQIKSSRQGDRMIRKFQVTYTNEKDLQSKLKHLNQINSTT